MAQTNLEVISHKESSVEKEDSSRPSLEIVQKLSSDFSKIASIMENLSLRFDKLEEKVYYKTPEKQSSPSNIGLTEWKRSIEGRPSSRRKKRYSSSSSESDSEVEDRRTSIFRQGLRATPSSIKGQASYVATVPEHTKIYLSSLTVKAAVSFFKQVDLYHKRYKPLRLPLATMLSPSCVNLLVSANRRQGINSYNFLECDSEQVLNMVQSYVQPRSKDQFREELKENANFPNKVAGLELANTAEFLESVLQYTQSFLLLVDFMADGNEANTPRCEDKEGGILKIFFAKFPNNYGRSIFTEMTKKKFSDFKDFTKEFFPHVESSAQLLKSANLEMKRYGGGPQIPNTPKPQVERRKPAAFAHIEPEQEVPHNNESDGDDNAVDNSEREDGVEDLCAIAGKPAAGVTRPQVPSVVNQVQPEVQACYNMILYGVCKRDNCRQSHDQEACRQTHQRLCILLRDSKFATSKSLLHPQELTELNNLIMNALDGGRKKLYMRVYGEVSLDGNAHTQVRVLLDTGASHSSYISKAFLEEHMDQLGKFNDEAKHEYVILGDSKTKLKVHGYVTVLLRLQHNSESTEAHMVKMGIIEHTSNDVVLGLPDIARSFPTFFLQEFGRCVEGFSSIEELLDPFPDVPIQTAPEEEDTYVPCSFTESLNFLEKSYEESIQEFRQCIDKQVNPEFMKRTKVKEMLEDWGFKAFVPSNWEGIKGIEPLELEWRSDMPDHIDSVSRYINPKLMDQATKEFERMKGYFYEPSTSPITSPLVIAPKATSPFIRLCGDYREPNKYVVPAHDPIPIPRRELEKARGYNVYLDIDMANSFHQIRLSERTSNNLTIKTRWGLFRPKFLPEGVGPASPLLQRVVRSIFADYDSFIIAVFDNILVLCHDYDDAFHKLGLVLQRCVERNMYLKFAKSFLGFSEVKFFGYIVNPIGIRLSEDRLTGILTVPFPNSRKKMQSFLGMANYFQPFVERYSEHAAKLNEMVHKDFNWDKQAWEYDYEQEWEKFKDVLKTHFMIHYPDYTKDWLMRTDASNVGIGVVLYMKDQSASGEQQLIPIACLSKKFSEQASKWSTIEQECYGIYYGVKSLAHMLLGKAFIIETDHNNLLWMSKSEVSKIIRWRIYLQGFAFLIRHIPRSENVVADYFSKSFSVISSEEGASAISDTARELFVTVHNARRGHVGVSRTYSRLNNEHPGHGIPIRVIQDLVRECPTCQKDRLGMVDVLKGVTRHLKVPHIMSSVGVDIISISPTDKLGSCALVVVVVFYSKFVWIYPIQDYEANTLAKALFVFFTSYGVFESIHSDPGSNITADVIKQLHIWFGVRHVFSLVDRHESNGVEGSNKQIARHLRALASDERIKDKWSDPTVLPIIMYILNSEINSETGYTPLELHFGSRVSLMQQLPSTMPVKPSSVLAALNQNLEDLRLASAAYQRDLVAKRAQSDSIQNFYQRGDLVLFNVKQRREKLSNVFLGPYEVLTQVKNDVEAKHVVTGIVKTFHVDRLKPFFGTKEEALRVAMLDDDQYIIRAIIAYKGDPRSRLSMSFEVAFEDGSVVWVPWSKDLADSVPFENFCQNNLQLSVLLIPSKEVNRWVSSLNSLPISKIKPGDEVYVNLRSWGELWYQGLPIPDPLHSSYYVRSRYTKWQNVKHTRIWIEFPDFDAPYVVDHFFVTTYGSLHELPHGSTLVDSALLERYPIMRTPTTTERKGEKG